MSLLQHAPRFEPADAESLALELYGLQGRAELLPGERDQNFAIECEGRRFTLKIANAAESVDLLEAQNAAMAHLAALALCPGVIPTADGRRIGQTSNGYWVRLLTWVDGVPFGSIRRHTLELFERVGRCLARVDRELTSFDHPAIHRDFHWDLAVGVRTVREYARFILDPEFRGLIEDQVTRIDRDDLPRFHRLRRSAIHNDSNDYNVLVGGGDGPFDRSQHVVGLIDFGDIVHSYTVADLAVAVAYAVLDKSDPLRVAARIVRGYHAVHALTDDDIAVLFALIKLRLCMSAAIAARHYTERPDDGYLAISQSGIRATLPKLVATPSGFAEAAFRNACSLEPVPRAGRIVSWLRTSTLPPAVASITERPAIIDLSVSSPLVSGDPLQNTESQITRPIREHLRNEGATIGIGRYGEARLLYTSPAFATDASEDRTVHLGVDVFAPVGTPVHAPLDGVVHALADNAAPLDYGPVVILGHETIDGERFYTLYGHLTRESLATLGVGQRIEAGKPFAAIGSADVNGGWTPHLHVQLIVDLLELDCDYPGVCRASEWEAWSALSPDPGVLVGLPLAVSSEQKRSRTSRVAERRRRVGRNLSLGYREPLPLVRGWMQYLFDENGRRFLDAYNNVPHAGHCHPRIVQAAVDQLRVLNTNTRYLHDLLVQYAAGITATLPDPLRVCFFVNSGSEANELALRLARTHTRRQDIIVLDSAYHGNTTTLIDISPYKFYGPAGGGRRPWVHVAPLPDLFRGRHRGTDARTGRAYSQEVSDLADHLVKNGSPPAAFIAETCPSVGGQIVFPPGYLSAVYTSVRNAGGVCIADEVQTAYGRMGTSFYAFEDQHVVPDIVVLGKPIGNGYPIGAVVTTEQIAGSFDNGMEFFSTFGGSTVSCAVGLAMLDVMQEEDRQSHARRVGDHLLSLLRELGNRFPIVGDVRGSGLFLGVELVRDRESLEPAREEADYVVNRLREESILIGTEGPDHNVLKIRPPMPFDFDDAKLLVTVLSRVLEELTM